MKILHMDGEISEKTKKEWYAHNCILIEEDCQLQTRYDLSVFAKKTSDNEEYLIKTFGFSEFPNEGEIMYCLLKSERLHKECYSFNAIVDKVYVINEF